MKKVITIAVVLMAMALIALPASATPISISVQAPLSVTGNGTGQVTFTFGLQYDAANNPINSTAGQVITGSSPFNSALQFAGWSTTPTGFVFDANANTFSPSNAVITFGNASTGTLAGTINYITLSSNGTGTFTLDVSLTGLTYTCGGSCTSNAVLSAFGDLGAGSFTTQLGNIPANSINDLKTYNNAGNLQSGNTSVSASLTAVPEPASLALLGTGLLTGGNFVRRKFRKS